MTLGKKIAETRRAAGLSQRTVCGDMITRNMLSLIENGSAQPSMDTLQYLAKQLGKPVSYFLDEEAVVSPNLQTMEALRDAYNRKDLPQALALTKEMVLPDPVFAWEFACLQAAVILDTAEEALTQNREGYARELLDAMAEPPLSSLSRRKLLLMARLHGSDLAQICVQLPSLDEELMLRSQAAFESGDPARAAALLEAAEDHSAPRWCLLRGKLFLAESRHQEAAASLRLAEKHFPQETLPLLELCFREMGDYQQAYLYACRRREASL